MRAAVLIALVAACSETGGGDLHSFDVETCALCHVDQHEAWRASRHAASATSPVFEALLPRVEKAWGSAARQRCESCHRPGFGGDDVIGCASCHAAVGNTAERDGALVVDTSVPLAGPLGEPGAAPHRSRVGEFLRSPSLCGTCHEVTGPELFVEPTLTHYRDSPAAADGVACADCHMPDLEDGPIAVGSSEFRRRRSHDFVGVDPAWGAATPERERATEATRALLQTAFEIRVERVTDDELQIELTNTCMAHRVPAGIAMFRDMWVDVEIAEPDGTQRTVSRAIELGADMMRNDSRVALPTDADAVVDRGLNPGETVTARVAVGVGAVATAIVRVRAIRSDTLEALGLESLPALDVIDASDRL